MKAYHILLVEDDRLILQDNREALERRGYRVTATETVRQAQAAVEDDSPDLLLLDIQLPDGSGLELCRRLREHTAAPILFLTSLGDGDQIVHGLRLGGDDYIVKPYRMEELLARIEARLRGVERLREHSSQRGLGALRLETARSKAYVGDADLLLSPKEYHILAILMQNPGANHKADEIFAAVWGRDAMGDVRTVRVHITNLREKMREAGLENPSVEQYTSLGYRLVYEA